MAEDLGVLEYQVRADVSEAISSAKQFDAAMADAEKTAAKVDKTAATATAAINTVGEASKNTAMKMTQASSAVERHIQALKIEAATARMSSQQKELYIAALNGATSAQLAEITQMRNYINTLNNATGSNSKFRGGVQQAGYQIQDFAVQVAGGTSAFVAFGQQGSQLAGVFGPAGAVAGALIAIVSVIGQVAWASRSAAADLTELANAGQRIADLKLDTLVKINNATRDFASSERLASYKKLGAEVLDLTTRYENQQLTTKRLREEAQKAQDAMQDVGGFFGGSAQDAAAKLASANEALNASLADEARLRSDVSGLQDKMSKLASEEAKEKEKLATADEKAAKKSQKAVESAAKKQQTAFDANAQKIKEAGLETEQLAIQYSNLKTKEDGTIDSTMRHTAESAKLAAQQQLNKQATEAQVNALAKEILAQDQLKQKYEEQKKAGEERNRLTAEFNPVQQAGTDYAKQQKDLESARALNLITEQQYQQQKEILARTYEQNRLAAAEEIYKQQSAGNEFLMNSLDALGSAATSTISGLLSGTMSVTEAMQNFANIILNQAVGALVEMGLNQIKNAMLSDALAQTQQANIVTTAAVGDAASTSSAAVQSANSATVAAAAAPAAAATSVWSFGTAAAVGGAALLGTYALARAASGRRYGGPVNHGSMYPVNEGGAPEMLTVGAKQYLMPNARGEVISNPDATGGNGGVTFIVNNNASNVVSTTQSYDESTKTVTLAVNEVARQLSTRTGPVSKALQGGYNVSGRTA